MIATSLSWEHCGRKPAQQLLILLSANSKMTELLLDELFVAIAVKVSTPKEIYRMARTCSRWYRVLETHRNQIIAEILEVTPWARCGGTTSLGHALKIWQEHITWIYLPEDHLHSPGHCVSALETQLALLELPVREIYLEPFDVMSPGTPRTTFGYKKPTSSRHCLNLAVGLMTHAVLFNNMLHTGLTLMWSKCEGLNKDAYGDLIFHLLAAPADMVLPMDEIVATFSTLAEKLNEINYSWIHHILASTLGRIILHEETAYLSQFLARFVQFWCHPAMNSYWQAYCQEVSDTEVEVHVLDFIVAKLGDWHPIHSNAILRRAWDACCDALFTGVRFNLVDRLPAVFWIQVTDRGAFTVVGKIGATPIIIIKERR